MIQTKVLVINMNYLGDALMTTPAIRVLKRHFQQVEIDVIAGATNSYGALEILSLDPDIDHLIARVDGGSLARGWQLLKVISKGKYDVVVVLPSLPFYNSIAKLAAGSRVITMPKAKEDIHMADHMLEVLSQAYPDSPADRQMVMEVPSAVRTKVKDKLSQLDPTRKRVIFNVGASRPQKRWPAAHFGTGAVHVLNAGHNVILTGGDNEQDMKTAEGVLTAVVRTGSFDNERFINLVGKTTLEELSGIIGMSDAIVTADTGAMHIAAALKTPTVALFGSTSPDFTGPYGGAKNIILDLKLECAPCGTHPTCGGRFQCMSGITPQLVAHAVESVLVVVQEDAACPVL